MTGDPIRTGVAVGSAVIRVNDQWKGDQAGVIIELDDTRIRVMWHNSDGSNPASDPADLPAPVDAGWHHKLADLGEALGLPDPAAQHPSNVIGCALERLRGPTEGASAAGLESNLWAVEAAIAMHDPDPCSYDHNELCQAHSLHPRPCPHAIISEAVGESKLEVGEGGEHGYRCEECTEYFVGEHYSAESCNETGRGVCCCQPCAAELDVRNSR